MRLPGEWFSKRGSYSHFPTKDQRAHKKASTETNSVRIELDSSTKTFVRGHTYDHVRVDSVQETLPQPYTGANCIFGREKSEASPSIQTSEAAMVPTPQKTLPPSRLKRMKSVSWVHRLVQSHKLPLATSLIRKSPVTRLPVNPLLAQIIKTYRPHPTKR